ncbi:flagellar hook-associated protein FlgL [Desulfolithobacter sp.]
MKATQGTTYRMLGSRLDDLTTRLEELRNIGATGKRLNKPSDDPSAIRPVLSMRKQISNVDRYLETMGISSDAMQATDGYLAHVEDIMQRAKEIAINAGNATLNTEDRAVLADELVNLQEELADTANGMINDRYIFAGFEDKTIPFVKNDTFDPDLYDRSDPTTWPYTYQGDENHVYLEISPGEKLQTNLTGNELFLGDADGDDAVDDGKVDLFAVLALTEDAIRTGDTDALNTQLSQLDTAAEQNRRLRSQMGNRASRIEEAMLHQEQVKIDLKQILSRYEDADAIEAFNAIVEQETAYEAALSITAKVSKLSILDYM